jgi:hypothetical protein
VPAGSKHEPAKKAKPTLNATIVPRTHLFGQPVTATIDVPAGLSVKTGFAPYRVISRTVDRHGHGVRYRFVIDCLSSRCVGAPGEEQEIRLPPVTIGFPNGKSFVGYWPPLRQASRLGPGDLAAPVLRGDLTEPDRPSQNDQRTLVGILLAVAAGLALSAAAVVGLRRLAWRPSPFWAESRRQEPSDLDYALLVTGLAAGGGSDDRRTALESLAVALERRGHRDLASQARDLAWSPRPPAGESVRRLAENAQRRARKVRA